MPPIMKQYYAFISYKRDDQKWAEWLQEKLEHYKLPSNLNGRSDLPKEIRPIFRDKSELAAGVLADEIQKALDNSKYLIVICSLHSAKSEWVNKEVQAFIDSGRTDKIIPFIIEGTPNSGNDETECFPKAIRELSAEDELLGVNINEMGRDAAAVKVVAQMFGLRFDDLWQRHEREKKRRRHLITAAITAFALMMAGFAFWMYAQRQQTLKANWQMLESQSRFVAKEVVSNAKENSYLARLVALEILPENANNPTDRPYTADAERALRKACEYKSSLLCNREGYVRFFDVCDNSQCISVKTDDFRFYDIKNGAVLKTIDYHSLGYFDVRIDGKQAIALQDGKCVVYDVSSNQRQFDLKYDNVVMALYLDRVILSAHSDSKVRFWNSFTGDELLEYSGDPKSESTPIISDNGKLFAYNDEPKLLKEGGCHFNQNIIVKNIETDETICAWNGNTDEFFLSLAFNHDGTKLATISGDAGWKIKIWDIEKGELQNIINIAAVQYDISVSFSYDGKYVVFGQTDGSIIMWNVNTGEKLRQWQGHKNSIIKVVFTPDDKYLVSSAGSEIRIWNLEYDKTPNVILNIDSHLAYAEITPDNNEIIYGINYTTLDAINVKTGKKQTINDNYNYSEDYRIYTRRLNDTTLILCDTKTNAVVQTFRITPNIHNGIISHDNMKLYTLSWKDNFDEFARLRKDTVPVELDIWDMKTGKKDGNFKLCFFDEEMPFEGYIKDVSYDNRYLAINLVYLNETDYIKSGRIVIIDSETGETMTNIKGKNAQFSTDGKYIATSNDDISIETTIWDASNGTALRVLNGKIRPNGSSVFSDDSKYIMLRTGDLIFNVNEVVSGNCVYSLEVENDTILAASFVGDEHIMTVSSKGNIGLWDFPPLQDLIDQTRERFKNRPLTEEERKMYYLE
ncbi:MAG: TIR domain-containing protein [Bacteroidales bacterium]|nr:TIR domain-containing protein [Bacteroidales bacterium]